MRPIGSKAIRAAKGFLLNTYCAIPSAFAAELYARQGWDTVTIDLQHGLIGYESAVAMLQAMGAIDVVPMVRVPVADAAAIGKMLDAGAQGVTCAMINTQEDAAHLVSCCRYGPAGVRSIGPLRAAMVSGAPYGEYAEAADAGIDVFAMAETPAAVENIDEICAVEGLTGIYIGTSDLNMSMGKGLKSETLHPDVEAAVEVILQACRKRGLVAGIPGRSVQQASDLIDRGFSFITMSSDAKILTSGAKALLDNFHKIRSASAART